VFVPEAVEALVMKLLEKEAKNRPADAVALRAALESAAATSGLVLPHTQSARVVDRASTPEPVPASQSPGWRPADSLAKTEYGLTSEPDVPQPAPQARTMMGSRATFIPGLKLGPIDRLPRHLAIAALGAPLTLVAFIIVAVVLFVSHKPTTQARDDAGTLIPSSARAPHATAVQINQAKAGGVGALETLAKDFPDDAAVQAELARAFASGGRYAEMLVIVRHLDPAAVDDEIERSVVIAAQKPESTEDAYAVLEGPLGARGVDGLIELATTKPPRARAVKSLAKPEVRAHASPAASVYLELKASTTCAAKRELLTRAHENGDARLLPLLRPLKNTSGCGVRRDCWPCLRKDDELEDAIRSIESRAAAKP